MHSVKSILCAGVLLAAALGLSACGDAPQDAPDEAAGPSAVGAIFVAGGEDLPEEKVYAQFADHQYTFALDAAYVYYVDAMEGEEPVVYAGDGNLTALTFGANIDSGVVGAEGAGVFRPETGGENALTAYYLQQDETGLYGTQTVTAEETLDPADLTDGQTLAVPAGTASVLLTPYDAGGNPLQSQTVTQEAPSAVVCYDGGGQVLASKVLRFAWDQG